MNTYIPLPNSSAGSPVQFSEPAAYSYESCHCCPRNCQINRTKKQGWCHSPAGIRAARAALHPWEEPCISGLHGSGTIFFSGCTLRCCFCQNYQISSEGFGKDISETRLEEIFLELQAQGAHNINLVTPTQYLPSLLPVLKRVKPQLSIPIVYNCGGYETLEAVDALAPYIDIWLPDLKYYSSELSARYSAAPDYFPVASAAVKRMIEHTGPLVLEDFSENGQACQLMKRRDPAAYGSSETQRRFHPPAPLDSRQPPGGAFSGKPYEPVHPLLPEQQISGNQPSHHKLRIPESRRCRD